MKLYLYLDLFNESLVYVYTVFLFYISYIQDDYEYLISSHYYILMILILLYFITNWLIEFYIIYTNFK
jgi:hypothetical protein